MSGYYAIWSEILAEIVSTWLEGAAAKIKGAKS
jgi:hypothetical protein